MANWRCFRRKFQYRFRHQLRHEPQFRSLFDSRAKYGIGFDVDSSFGFECGVGLCINLEISLIPNFDIGLSVGFDSETRFDGKLCSIFSTLFLSLRDCTNGDIWVSLNLRKKSEEEFLCVMAHDSVDSVRKRDKGASLQRFLCCVSGIVERGPHSRVEIVLHSCFNRMRPGVLYRNAFFHLFSWFSIRVTTMKKAPLSHFLTMHSDSAVIGPHCRVFCQFVATLLQSAPSVAYFAMLRAFHGAMINRKGSIGRVA